MEKQVAEDLKARRVERLDLKAIYETSRLLSASLDLNFVLNNLLLIAMSKLLVTRGLVLMYEPLEDAYHVAASKGVSGLKEGSTIRLGKVEPSRMQRGEDVPEALLEHRIDLLLPVAYQHRQIGFIGLGKKATGGVYEETELEFIQSLINMSSAAVHNSLMVEELKVANLDLDNKIQQLNTLFDLSQEFNATLDREHLVKLLTFALMGQMLIRRFLFLLRIPEKQDGDATDVHLEVIASKGLREGPLTVEVMQRLCALEELVVVQKGNGVPDEWQEMRDRGIEIALPLRLHGQTYGVLCLGPKMTGKPYQSGDIEFLSALGNLALVSIQNTYLVEERIEKERLQQEMRLAREIQERLQPAQIPDIPGVNIAALALSSRHVAGDYFDVIALDAHRVLLAIADVTGKGVPASLLMANLQACLRVLVSMESTLEDATGRINNVIHENTGFDKFITFFWGIFDARDRSFVYVNAGHNPPVLVRAGGEMEYLEEGGVLLGIMRNMSYQQGAVTLLPGDALVMFTDGVTEAMNPEQEEYDEQRLEAVLCKHQTASATDLLDIIRRDVDTFTRGAPLSDDLTMLVLKGTELPSA